MGSFSSARMDPCVEDPASRVLTRLLKLPLTSPAQRGRKYRFGGCLYEGSGLLVSFGFQSRGVETLKP